MLSLTSAVLCCTDARPGRDEPQAAAGTSGPSTPLLPLLQLLPLASLPASVKSAEACNTAAAASESVNLNKRLPSRATVRATESGSAAAGLNAPTRLHPMRPLLCRQQLPLGTHRHKMKSLSSAISARQIKCSGPRPLVQGRPLLPCISAMCNVLSMMTQLTPAPWNQTLQTLVAISAPCRALQHRLRRKCMP